MHVGKLDIINDMAKQARATCVIHTGDFGFYDVNSVDRMNEKYEVQTGLYLY